MAAEDPGLNVVTGVYGFTGKYIAHQLLSMGERVMTLTGHPHRESPFSDQVKAFPFSFDDPQRLRESLKGATTLYSTYWIRFPRGNTTFEKAVENTKVLLRSAKEAGISRLVHISITNASEDSPLPYFRGKGIVERAIMESGLSYAIVRPTVIFGTEGILINNIAWLARKFPVFALPGQGDYRLQPVFVEDVARIAVEAAHQPGNVSTDAVGPETYTFEDLVRLICEKIGIKARLVRVPPDLFLLLGKLVGYFVGDVVLTRDEVVGLMSNLLVSQQPPTGRTLLSDWLEANAAVVGLKYASELARHYR